MSNVPPHISMPVGVIVERRKSENPWADFYWRATGVLAGQPETPAWTILSDDGERTTFYAGTAIVALYRSETGFYRDNLTSGAPALWIALRAADGRGRLRSIRRCRAGVRRYDGRSSPRRRR